MIRIGGSILTSLALLLCLAVPAESADSIVVRDHSTGIRSNTDRFISFRYMRHLWLTPDGAGALAVQQGGYDSHYLTLYRTLDNGLTWDSPIDIAPRNNLISDGVLDRDSNLLLTPTILLNKAVVNVFFVRFNYDPQQKSWQIDPGSPTVVFKSSTALKGSRATVAIDGNGVIWIAFRVHDVVADHWYYKVCYSVDDGLTWLDSGREFGLKSSFAEKCGKILAVGSGIGFVYQDGISYGTGTDRVKRWAYRDDTQGLGDPWQQQQVIGWMLDHDSDFYGSHWSVAADWKGNVHLCYQDGGVRYSKYVHYRKSWEPSISLSPNGFYSGLSVGLDNDVFLTKDVPWFLNSALFGKKYDTATGLWSNHIQISAAYLGRLRMSMPDRFRKHLPILYQTGAAIPYELKLTLVKR